VLILKNETLSISAEDGIVKIRQMAQVWAVELGFSLVNQTKIGTAASELARNMLNYGGSGTVHIEALNHGGRQGLRLIFEDQGPGIPDMEEAMKHGYSSTGGLGLGLTGTRRLMDEFEITSRLGEGTRVSVIKWK